MKIAHLTATFLPYPSGTGMVCYHNAMGLAKLGHDVTVITAAHPPGEYDYPEEITVQRLKPIFRIGNAPLLPGLLSLKDYDIVHLHWPFIFGADMLWLISKLRGIPYVLTHHNDLIGDGLRKYIFDGYSAVASRIVLGGASKFAVVSSDHAADCQLTPQFKKRWEDVVEIPNGVDIELFQPGLDGNSVREKYGLTHEHEIVMFVGGLDRAHHFKGVGNLIRAFAKIDRPNARLMLVGDGDMRADYEAQVSQAGIADKTIFTGSITHDDLPKYYNAANALVLSSFPPESFGMVLIEAMACGTPAIAHNIPGVRSVVNHGEDGFLVEAGNEPKLVEAITQVISDIDLQQEMGRKGRQKIEQKYAWSQIVKKLEATYQDIVT